MEYYNEEDTIINEYLLVDDRKFDTSKTFEVNGEGLPLENARIIIESFNNTRYRTVQGKLTNEHGKATLKLTNGEVYRITIQKDGYTPQTSLYYVNEDETLIESFDLVSSSSTGTNYVYNSCGRNVLNTTSSCTITITCGTPCTSIKTQYTLFNGTDTTNSSSTITTTTGANFLINIEDQKNGTINTYINNVLIKTFQITIVNQTNDGTSTPTNITIAEDYLTDNQTFWILGIGGLIIVIGGGIATKINQKKLALPIIAVLFLIVSPIIPLFLVFAIVITIMTVTIKITKGAFKLK
jgi:hypothetical protein